MGCGEPDSAANRAGSGEGPISQVQRIATPRVATGRGLAILD